MLNIGDTAPDPALSGGSGVSFSDPGRGEVRERARGVSGCR